MRLLLYIVLIAGCIACYYFLLYYLFEAAASR